MTLDTVRHVLAMRQQAGERLSKREREFLCGLRADPYEDAPPGSRYSDLPLANGSTIRFAGGEDEPLRGRAGRFCAEP